MVHTIHRSLSIEPELTHTTSLASQLSQGFPISAFKGELLDGITGRLPHSPTSYGDSGDMNFSPHTSMVRA